MRRSYRVLAAAWLGVVLTALPAAPAPTVFNSQAAFNAAVPGQTMFNFEVSSGFPAAPPDPASSPVIGTVNGVTFNAVTHQTSQATSGTQAISGPPGCCFDPATVNFQGLGQLPQAVGMFGLDLTAGEIIRVDVDFTTAGLQSFNIALGTGAAEFTPTFFGVLDSADTIQSISLRGTEAANTTISRAYLIDDLSHNGVSTAPLVSIPEQTVGVVPNPLVYPPIGACLNPPDCGQYGLSMDNGQVKVSVAIKLVDLSCTTLSPTCAPETVASDALVAQWESGIEGIWSNQFQIVDGAFTYPLLVDANFVTTNDPDFVVRVDPGTCRSNMRLWCVGLQSWGDTYQDEAAAHELGHMLGLYDEYTGGTLAPGFDPASVAGENPTSIMVNLASANGGGPEAKERHFLGILANLQDIANRPNLDLAQNPLAQPYVSVNDAPFPGGLSEPLEVPAPAAVMLVIAGALVIGGSHVARRRHRRG